MSPLWGTTQTITTTRNASSALFLVGQSCGLWAIFNGSVDSWSRVDAEDANTVHLWNFGDDADDEDAHVRDDVQQFVA